MGWITPVIQSLQNRVATCIESVCGLLFLAAMFDDWVIKTISSDAELR